MCFIKKYYYIFRNKILPDWLLKINGCLVIKDIICKLYTSYLRIRYQDNFPFWFNHLFNNNFLFKQIQPNHELNYSYFLFALFSNWPYNNRIIYKKYHSGFLEYINLFSEELQAEMLIVYLWYFTAFMNHEELNNLLFRFCDLLENNSNDWWKIRINMYYHYLITHFKFRELTNETKNKLESMMFIIRASL